MAAIDLTGATNVPYIYATTIATTYQEFQLPSWCCRVLVYASKAAWVTVTGEDSPSDGGSVGTHKIQIPANQAAEFVIQGPEQRPIRTGLTYARSIFVASQSSTCTVTVVLEAGVS